MKAIKFKESNVTLAENQPEYIPLPVLYDSSEKNGTVVSCYRLSLWERLRVLFRGRIWVGILTFHRPLQPQFLTTRKKNIIAKRKNK